MSLSHKHQCREIITKAICGKAEVRRVQDGGDQQRCMRETQASVSIELARLTGIDVHTSRMHHLGAHRFTGLDDPPVDISARSPRSDITAPTHRAARGGQR